MVESPHHAPAVGSTVKKQSTVTSNKKEDVSHHGDSEVAHQEAAPTHHEGTAPQEEKDLVEATAQEDKQASHDDTGNENNKDEDKAE